MSGDLRAAYTKHDPSFPGYINISRIESGIRIIVRGDPNVVSDGTFICGHKNDKGVPGRCTPGDDNCNNYCNLAPQKGPMADAPRHCAQTFEGKVAELLLTSTEWDQIVRQLKL